MNVLSGDAYLRSVLNFYSTVGTKAADDLVSPLLPIIRAWATSALNNIYYSGSYAKGTAVNTGSDVDLFISLSSTVQKTMKEIYESLLKYDGLKPYSPRAQNVSVGVTVLNNKIDLVPAKQQAPNTSDHTIYRKKSGTWRQTNIQTHVNYVAQSNRLDEIKLLKIWRNRMGIEFPSFYLEMTVIEALNGRHIGQLANNMLIVFQYLSSTFKDRQVIDPANTNNSLSDELTEQEKYFIYAPARSALQKQHWADIIQ